MSRLFSSASLVFAVALTVIFSMALTLRFQTLPQWWWDGALVLVTSCVVTLVYREVDPWGWRRVGARGTQSDSTN